MSNDLARDDDEGGVAERPTLKTIARLTGLAVPTVSRALSDAPDIGRATKARVRETAERIGYRPNRAGVRLRTGKTNVIALVHATDHEFMNHTVRLISSVARGLRGTPYHLIITPFFPDEDRMAPIRYLVETASADAVILNEIEPEDPRVDYLLSSGVVPATHGRTVWGDRHPWFDFDNTVFARLAVEEMARRGRRRVLLVAPPRSQNYARHMIAGATAAAEAAGAALEILATATSHDTSEVIEAALAARLDRAPRPDGIVSASTSSSVAAVAAVERAGLVVGADIDVAGKEALPFLSRFRPEALVIHEDVGRAGSFLARAVLNALANPDAPPMGELDVPKGFAQR